MVVSDDGEGVLGSDFPVERDARAESSSEGVDGKVGVDGYRVGHSPKIAIIQVFGEDPQHVAAVHHIGHHLHHDVRA